MARYIGVGALSSIGVNFAIQKIMNKRSSGKVGRGVLLDISLISAFIGGSILLSMNVISPDINKLKKSLLLRKN